MFSRFFIDRPVLATVMSIVIVLVGAVAFLQLPVAQYPEVAPPTITVTTLYPGANARTVAETVATPIETEVNGVEDMLYMSSQCTNDGQMTLNVTFAVGTDLDMAQVLVQNRVAIAQSKLPEEVRRQGVTTKKKSPSILLCVNLISPDDRYDSLYLSNYGTIRIKDDLSRIEGVGDVIFFGGRDYSMRIWVDPTKLAARSMSVNDVLNALREQNVQVAAGRVGQPPTEGQVDFQYTINAQGRLIEPSEFAEVIVKYGDEGQVTRLKDVGTVELGSKSYDQASYIDGKPTVTIAIFQRPGSNAIETADAVKAKMAELKRTLPFPEGVDYAIIYDTTVFVRESINEVYKTIFEAFVLVFIVVLLFLQDWRATILPMIEVPICLTGTFFAMALLGFSLNNLSLFGLVLAIGIVVDDAIVVIENVERWLAMGYPAKEATQKAMEEVTGPVIATALVLGAVFIPTAFLGGISGQFYRQFALTIAASTFISALNALTMTPARCALMFATEGGAHGHGGHKQGLPRWLVGIVIGLIAAQRLSPLVASMMGHEAGHGEHEVSAAFGSAEWWQVWGPWLAVFAVAAVLGGLLLTGLVNRVLGVIYAGFNKVFDLLTAAYGGLVARALRISVIMLLLYAGLLGLTYIGFLRTPTGFIPDQDKGYLLANAQLPEGSSLARAEAVGRQMTAIGLKTEGVAHMLVIPGYSLLTGSNASNAVGAFVILKSFEERVGPGLSAPELVRGLIGRFSTIQDAMVLAFGAPPIDGLGSTGGFKLMVKDDSAAGPAALQANVQKVMRTAGAQPGLVGVFSSYRADQPQLYLEIDRAKVKSKGVSLEELFGALQAFLGSSYVNDFTFQDRNWQVTLQADARYRERVEDIQRLQVRNDDGRMVPLGSLVGIREVTGPALVTRYNLKPAAEVVGGTRPGVSSGQALSLVEQVAERELPQGFLTEWTELSYQQVIASRDLMSKLVFPLAVVFVFLVLASQYESWSLPLAVILIVPMCLLAALAGLTLRGMSNDIFAQIGFVVLVGLASKNAILIVEFAKARTDAGEELVAATIEACRLRFRPILMTSFAFILGVLPLVLARGAGFEMRRGLGTTVFSGMIGVTIFGLIFTPVFFYVISKWFGRKVAPTAPAPEPTPVNGSGADGVGTAATGGAAVA